MRRSVCRGAQHDEAQAGQAAPPAPGARPSRRSRRRRRPWPVAIGVEASAGRFEEEVEPGLAGRHLDRASAAGRDVAGGRAAGEAAVFGKLPDEGAVGCRGRAAESMVEMQDDRGDARLAAEG